MKPPSMQSLKDTQNERDHRKIAIDRVGVKNLRYPIQVRDKARSVQSTIANVALTVDLPHHYKGTHMSRFIEVLNEHGPVLHVDKIKTILVELLAKLDSQKAHAEFEFPFFLEKKAPVTGAAGLMDYTARFSATMQKGEFDFVLTVVVPVTTLCPCSKAISDAGAHNQRGHVTIAIRFGKPIWIEELIQLVESCASSELYSLLKRPDEKAVTERAYRNPVFVEDLVRNIAARCNRDPNITWYRIEAENFESIHNHNAYALVEKGEPAHEPVPLLFMLNRILAACIIGFWLVMNALLLRVEISPDKSRIIAIPPSYVLKLMFRHAQPSELNVFENKKPIGSLSLRPQPARDESKRVLDFNGHLLVGLPLAARQRVTWDGSLEMNRQLEVRNFRFNSKAQGSDYTTHLAVDAPRRLVNFSVSLKDKIADTRSVSMDDLTRSGLLSQLGMDDSLLAGIKQRLVAPVVSASASELAIGSEKVDAYRLTVQQDGSMLAEIYVSQLGQVLEVRTPFGYTLSSQSAPP